MFCLFLLRCVCINERDKEFIFKIKKILTDSSGVMASSSSPSWNQGKSRQVRVIHKWCHLNLKILSPPPPSVPLCRMPVKYNLKMSKQAIISWQGIAKFQEFICLLCSYICLKRLIHFQKCLKLKAWPTPINENKKLK